MNVPRLPNRFPLARLKGLTGCNYNRDRMVVSFSMEDGTVKRLAVTISDLRQLSLLVKEFEPHLAELWSMEDEYQR